MYIWKINKTYLNFFLNLFQYFQVSLLKNCILLNYTELKLKYNYIAVATFKLKI